MSSFSSTLRIDPGHRALPGHFPGHPVVPGVVWLAEIVTAAGEQLGFRSGPSRWRRIRFVRPVAPATPVRLTLEGSADAFSFRLTTLDDQPVASGQCAHVSLE